MCIYTHIFIYAYITILENLYYFNFLAQESIPYSIDTSELSYMSCPIHGAFAHNWLRLFLLNQEYQLISPISLHPLINRICFTLESFLEEYHRLCELTGVDFSFLGTKSFRYSPHLKKGNSMAMTNGWIFNRWYIPTRKTVLQQYQFRCLNMLVIRNSLGHSHCFWVIGFWFWWHSGRYR